MNKKNGSLPSDSPARSPAETATEALAWAVSAGAVDKVVEHLAAKNRRRQRRRLVVASAAAVVLLIAGFVWRAGLDSRVQSPATPASAIVIAPPRQVLSDGSIVELKDSATVAEQFTSAFRRVALQNGEAHFQVAKNPARPFVVVAGGVEVRAVGTAFSVQLGGKEVAVLVTEGRVAIDQPTARSATTDLDGSATPAGIQRGSQTIALVDAGHRIVIDLAPQSAPPPVVAVTVAERDDRLSWRVPRLEFSGTPLAVAVPMFNKYGAVRLVLEPTLGPLQMSGTLRADDIDSLLLLLKNEFSIAAERRGDGEFFLHRR